MIFKIAIQNQIELLQQQQAVLYQQQLVSNPILGQAFPNRSGSHRRVQSTVPVGMPGGAFGGAAMGQFGAQMPGIGADAQGGMGRGHGRRHSVNVLNKSPGASFSYSNNFAQEGFDDGFAPPPAMTAHSRQASRADSSWRMSECLCWILFLFTHTN